MLNIDHNGFIFVLTPITIRFNTPFEVIDGHFLKKANDKEINLIKPLIKQFNPLERPFAIYENDIQFTPRYDPDSGISISGECKYHDLSPSHYRYWIITYKNTNLEIGYIEKAAILLDNDISLGFQIRIDSEGNYSGDSFQPNSLLNYYYDHRLDELLPKRIKKKDLYEMRQNYQHIKKIEPEHECKPIYQALHRYSLLKLVPHNTGLMIIGMFSVIESLVTHNPTLRESADSLTHQISTKLPLLNKRFKTTLNYDNYFREMNESKIWKRLYEYRSAIVHGEERDFNRRFQALRKKENVFQFLKEATKKLLYLSLREPILMMDLKRC